LTDLPGLVLVDEERTSIALCPWISTGLGLCSSENGVVTPWPRVGQTGGSEGKRSSDGHLSRILDISPIISRVRWVAGLTASHRKTLMPLSRVSRI
jgi:hypothetical protein